MYGILITASAETQLKKLDERTRLRINPAIDRLRLSPERYVKKLAGDKGYSLRVGDYRVLMDIDVLKRIILVNKIGHRKNVYD